MALAQSHSHSIIRLGGDGSVACKFCGATVATVAFDGDDDDSTCSGPSGEQAALAEHHVDQNRQTPKKPVTVKSRAPSKPRAFPIAPGQLHFKVVRCATRVKML